MRISVQTSGFVSAADACRTGNQIAALVCESLAGKLGGYASMAGDDATSAEFAASYDDGARQALDTLAELTHAFIGLGRLLTASGTNHHDAETASAAASAYTGGSLHEDDYVRVSPAPPPSCLGVNEVSLGTVESWILDHVEGFVWPGADVELLRDAGTAWRRAGADVADLEGYCDSAAVFLEQQVSPEVPLAFAALDEVRSLVADTTEAFVEMGTACEEYADAVRATHDRTRALLAEIGQMVVEGVAISAIVGGLTGGFGAGAAGSAAIARIGAQAPRFHVLLVSLRATGTTTAGRLRTAREGLDVVRKRAEKFARVRVRDERGEMRLPGGWRTSIHRQDDVGGHVVSKHVGKSAHELAERARTEGIPYASTFSTAADAERVISNVLRRRSEEVQEWLANGGGQLRIDAILDRPTGASVDATGAVHEVSGVRMILRRSDHTESGYRIHTAYPQP